MAQQGNRMLRSSSWTVVSGSLRWTKGSWSWGCPLEEVVVEGGSGVKEGGSVWMEDLVQVGRTYGL